MADFADSLPGEIWKPVVGFVGSYEVSSLGRVKALERMVDRGVRGFRLFPERIMTLKRRGRYLSVQFYNGGVGVSHTVHRAVCEAFHGPKPTDQHEVAHWDGDPHNNACENLRWATKVENAADRKRHGRNQCGPRNCNNKLAVGDIHAIRALHGMGWSSSKISSIFRCSATNIRNIINRKIWQHLD